MLNSSADERFAIDHYFEKVERRFRYETIVRFLVEYHGISVNMRRVRQYQLPRTNQVHSEPA